MALPDSCDYPANSLVYTNWEKAAQEMKREGPTVLLIFDRGHEFAF